MSKGHERIQSFIIVAVQISNEHKLCFFFRPTSCTTRTLLLNTENRSPKQETEILFKNRMEHILCIEYPEHFWSKNYVNLFTYMVFFDEPTSIFVQSVAFEGDRRRSTDI